MLLHRLKYLIEDEKEVLRRNAKLGLKRDESGGAMVKTEFDMVDQGAVGGREELRGHGGRREGPRVRDLHRARDGDRRPDAQAPRARPRRLPRAGIARQGLARPRAIHGRDYVVPEDLYALAEDVLLHRIRASYEALAEGRDTGVILEEMLGELGRA